MTSRTKKLIVQFCAYAAVGGISVLCEWSLFAIFSFAVHWHYIDAVIVSFTAGTILNLILGKKFPFRASKIGRGREAMMIFFVNVVGLGLNIILMAFFISALNWNPFGAKVFASGIVFCWNFASRKFIIYRDIVYVSVPLPSDKDASDAPPEALPAAGDVKEEGTRIQGTRAPEPKMPETCDYQIPAPEGHAAQQNADAPKVSGGTADLRTDAARPGASQDVSRPRPEPRASETNQSNSGETRLSDEELRRLFNK